MAMSTMARELISVASANGGELRIHKTDQTGEFVRAGRAPGSKNYVDPAKPTVAVSGIQALEELIGLELVAYQGGNLYVVVDKIE